MFNRVKFSLRKALVLTLSGLFVSVSAQSQAIPTQALVNAPSILLLNTKQQAVLGIHVATVQASTRAQLLANATVVTAPGKEFTVSAPYAGQISRLMVGLGDSVKSGTALAQFTSPMLGDARRLSNEALIEQKNANAAAQRDQALFDEGIIPAVRLQLSRSKQDAAQSLARSREAELSAAGMRFDTDSSGGYATGTLKAPFLGVVIETFTSVGQRVEAGAVLFKLADDRQLQLDIQLSTEKAAQLQVGDEVSIASRNAKAKILGVSRAVDTSQTARARAMVTSRGSLQMGEIVPVTVHANSRSDTSKSNTHWLIPARAVTQWRGKPLVFVATEQGFEAQVVTVLSSTDDLSLIQIALSPGAKVAITGIASLRALLQKDE